MTKNIIAAVVKEVRRQWGVVQRYHNRPTSPHKENR